MTLTPEQAQEYAKTFYMTRAEAAASAAADQRVYAWCSVGRENWLRANTISDVIGYVCLPKGLPDYLDLPDDEYEEE